MAMDQFTNPDNVTILGKLTVKTDPNGNPGGVSFDNNLFHSDGFGNLTANQINASGSMSFGGGSFTLDSAGNLSIGTISESQTAGTVQTLVTGNTITTPASIGVVRVTAAAAVTGIILPAGSNAGQNITVIHEGASGNTITFAAAGTSNVADGASDTITGPSARTFVWDSVTALWYATH